MIYILCGICQIASFSPPKYLEKKDAQKAFFQWDLAQFWIRFAYLQLLSC